MFIKSSVHVEIDSGIISSRKSNILPKWRICSLHSIAIRTCAIAFISSKAELFFSMWFKRDQIRSLAVRDDIKFYWGLMWNCFTK